MSSPYASSPGVSTPTTATATQSSVSLVRLTSLATSALTSLLERQRLASLTSQSSSSPTSSSFGSSSSPSTSAVKVDSTPQITRILKSLREGILVYELERNSTAGAMRGRKREVESETRELRDQFKRMRGMLVDPDSIVDEYVPSTPS